jgi:hypothetical protein
VFAATYFMKDFRTVVRALPSNHLIGLKTPVLTTGSCFSDAIGDRLRSFKVPTAVNPFGTGYNPISIHKGLTLTEIPAHSFIQSEDIHLHYDFHSNFSATSHEVLQQKMQKCIDDTRSFLKNASWLMITYGTAWVYHRKETGDIVSNCHKQNAVLFDKSLLSQKQILESFSELHQKLKADYPNLRIILTVSPVRHLKDTLELNSVSKSILRLSCHTLAEQYDDVEYFPAFEMMMDDLRDYRFYKSDMIHPSSEAEDYIWENFVARYGDPLFLDFIKKWKAIQAALAHKPFHPQSTGHQHFISDTLRKLEELSHLVDVKEETTLLRRQLVHG